MKILFILLLWMAEVTEYAYGALVLPELQDDSLSVDITTHELPEVTVSVRRGAQENRISSLPVEEIGRHYLLQHNGGNFVQTLSSLPGIASMDIGAGLSKPVIRGMAFNRVAVVDRGIVQQNQQWGADHGLEVDQYDVDKVRVYKGPMSLYHGSDAMGGVIEILPPHVPENDMFWGDATLIGKSNNDLLGMSVMASRKRGRWFLRARTTVQQYADYRIPADSLTYLTWQMPLYGRRLKNTAGREYNFSLSARYAAEKVESGLHLSAVSTKNGFFPGAHGIPSLGRLEPDGDLRNVELPFATSDHLKLVSHSAWQTGEAARLLVDLGFQRNNRCEMAQFHTHYGNQTPPVNNRDKELQFLLHTYTANMRRVTGEGERWMRTAGISGEYQHNRVGGYSFLLPGFDRLSAGAYWLHSVRLNDRFLLTGGIRYDVGRLSVQGYYDALLADYLQTQGYPQEQATFYAQRAAALRRDFGDFSGGIGFTYTPDDRHTLKMNAGRSFRYPGANELASNGVHHGAFRHESGNNGLNPERGVQLDLEYRFAAAGLRLVLNPFVSHFSNYIYLEPTGEWSLLPHAGQIYAYRQSGALMAGGEVTAAYVFDGHWRLASDLSYVYNRNLTDHYPLPFSPPATIASEVAYTGEGGGALAHYTLRLDHRWVMAQHRIAKNEEQTSGTSLWGLSAHLQWRMGGRRVITDIQVDNLFDVAFLNHLSFYRRLNAPEPGRNLQLILKVPF